jgi:hypothetical protein
MAKKKYTIDLVVVNQVGAGDSDFYYAPDIDLNDTGTDIEVRHFNINNLTCKIEVDETKHIKSNKKQEIDDATWSDITTVNQGA